MESIVQVLLALPHGILVALFDEITDVVALLAIELS
jgi:hypothetical protein